MSTAELEQLRAEVDYYRDRAALLRAKLYRRGLGRTARLDELERALARAEQQLSDARARERR